MSESTTGKTIKGKKLCPFCKGEASSESGIRPFCSERCKMLDLGAWANESYRIAGPPRISETEDEEEDFS